jgi:DNA primase|tara:strand:- start:913 stop:1179 length:267 start_codon:yes stop_codon:yes gene_type:complete
MYEDRKYIVFDVNELDTINFNQVLETSADTVRLSADGLKTFVKYDGNMPSSVASLITKGPEMSWEEITELMSTEDWQSEVLPDEDDEV